MEGDSQVACSGSLISKWKVLLKTIVTQNPAAPDSRRAEIGRSGSDGGQGKQQALILLVGQEVGHLAKLALLRKLKVHRPHAQPFLSWVCSWRMANSQNICLVGPHSMKWECDGVLSSSGNGPTRATSQQSDPHRQSCPRKPDTTHSLSSCV